MGKIIGIMRSFDQFANLVLEHAFERVIVEKRFADVPLGLYVIRGENTVLLGQIDEAKDKHATEELLEHVSVEEVLEAKKALAEERLQQSKISRYLSRQIDQDHFDGL